MVPGKAIKSYEIFKYKELFNIYKLHPSLSFFGSITPGYFACLDMLPNLFLLKLLRVLFSIILNTICTVVTLYP